MNRTATNVRLRTNPWPAMLYATFRSREFIAISLERGSLGLNAVGLECSAVLMMTGIHANQRCITCGGTTIPSYRTRDHNRRITMDSFEYLRCSACGTISL